LLIKEDFAQVVCAMEDPNPLVSGRGIQQLRQAGIEVMVGVLEQEARELNQAFIKYVRGEGPYVSLKLALSLDGKVAAADGSSQWITGAQARDYGQVLRHEHQAIMVGIGTVLAADPRLDCRMPGAIHQPIKIVLDSHGRLPAKARIFETGQVWVVTRESTQLNLPRAKIIRVPSLEITTVLQALGKVGISSILVEGGGTVAGSLIGAGLVDKYWLFYAPKLLGGDGLGFTDALRLDNIDHAIDLTPAAYTQLGRDLLAVCYPKGDADVHRDS
jgi:diaminohydroxyphosphoribosylaminopyrimidine deaminase/5-amino-6-(5-phosphoribosylamino)uracil reductase